MNDELEPFRGQLLGGFASLQRYLVSIEVRQDTKISLLLGLCIGLGCVVFIAVYPGKPIDYSGAGMELPEEMRGGKRSAVRTNSAEGGGAAAQQGETQESACRRDEAGLRRRKGPKNDPHSPHENADRDHKEQREIMGPVDWWQSRLDEEKVAKRIGSSKAARMLGLTEDQVRQAVLDAKEEMENGEAGTAASAGGNDSEGAIGLSGAVSLIVVVLGLTGLWLHLSTNQHGPIARFLAGAFPREMATLGLSNTSGVRPRR